MAAAVATPLERQFSTIPGLDSMTSTSARGSTSITLQFDLNRNLDGAAQDVQAAIAGAGRRLPAGMPNPPTLQKVNPADQPIMMLSLNSPTLPLSTVNEYAETMIAQRISMVPGVAQVGVYGGQKYAVRVQLDPNLMASRGVSLSGGRAGARQNTTSTCRREPCGARSQSFTVQANGQLFNAAAYRPLIVA